MNKIKENLVILLCVLPILLICAFLIGRFSMLGFLGVLALIIGAIFFVYILKKPFLGLLLTIFTLPFERIPTLHVSSITLKIDQAFAGMTIIALLLKILFDKKKIFPYSITIPIILYCLVSLISTAFSQDLSRAIMIFTFVIIMIAISIATANILDNPEKLQKAIKILFLTTLIACIFGIYQFLGDIAGLPITLTGLKDIYTKAVLGFPRIQAFSMEPLYFANFLFIPLGLAGSFYFLGQTKITNKSRLLVFIILILLNIILGISRGAYIALAVMILFFAIFLLRKVLTLKNVIVALLAILIVGSLSYGFLKISRPDALEQFIGHATVKDYSQGESVQKRLKDFSKAIEFWQTSPWIGIGPGNYGPAYLGYPSHDTVTNWDIVNNQYIESLTETGILGLVTLFATFLIIIWRSVTAYFKTQNPFLKATMFGLLAAFIAIIVQYNFFSTLYIMYIWVLIGMMIATQNLCFKSEINR